MSMKIPCKFQARVVHEAEENLGVKLILDRKDEEVEEVHFV